MKIDLENNNNIKFVVMTDFDDKTNLVVAQ